MTTARATQVSLADTPYYHCVARCVRRAFLCGIDHLSGQNYEHRRAWIATKMKSLSHIFSIDICAYVVMSNHYHVILHVDDQAAATWSQSEVIDRWTKLFSLPPLIQRYLRGQTTTDAEVNKVNEIVDQWRYRLTDISWYMRVLNESIARPRVVALLASVIETCRRRRALPWPYLASVLAERRKGNPVPSLPAVPAE